MPKELPDNLENMTDQELLHEAVVATEQEVSEAAWTKDEPADETKGEEAADAEQPRNERGQFVKKEEAEEQQEEEQPEADEEQQEEAEETDEGEAVPSWRLREIAEERRQAQAERDALRAELARVQAQQPRPQPTQQQQIDPLIDPQGFAAQMRNEFAREVANIRLDSNLQVAHLRHGETFERAYEALLQEGRRGNGQLIDQLTRTGNPGESIVRWYKQQELLSTTGGDLAKYRENLLKDPEFLQQAIEVVRAQATGEQPRSQNQSGNRSGRPNNITRLPPSLQRVPGGSAQGNDPIDTDDSDRAVFDFAFR